MKYKELIQFEPIEEVIKFNQLNNEDYRQSLIKTFVFSNTYETSIIPEICRELDYTSSSETFGLQIVGDYGTGKSHLMSLFSLIAEDASLLPLVQSDKARQVLGVIAGKYKIIRFEMGTTDELWNIVCEQIDDAFHSWNLDYSISTDSKGMYKDRLNRMMAFFEEQYPDKGLMIVIDEMLEYLRGSGSDDKLNRVLSVLRALGEFSDRTKFRMVFGVQQQIYSVPQFQFAAKMLNHANDRYRQISITKQDVQYVVQQRLLHKNESQKQVIRQHLSQFTEFFTDMHTHLDDYVNLFPVNPSFFENFQQIRVAKSKREVMKTLSRKFKALLDEEVPASNPGLICYDDYWNDLNVPAMMTEADVRRVSDIMTTIHQKIDDNFTAARVKNAPLAHRIANACAVKILQDSLEKTNGVSAENLIDDLCYLDARCLDREFLLDTITTIAKQIITATDGQYFEKNDNNQEFHLRIEGGVNYEQKIKDFAATMSDDNKDSHFFNFLVEFMPIEVEQYRREFKIFTHSIDWKSHKTMLDGYIFMGNAQQRSTTHPQQNFYIYFMPIFNKANIIDGNEPDSIYVHLDKVSDEMKELIELYASAEALIASVDSSQKPFYEQYKKRYEDKLKPVFQRDFTQCTEIIYQGEKQPITPQMMTGGSKEQVISNIASTLLDDYFCQKLPNYPKFTLLKNSITSGNRGLMLKGARQKIAIPELQNRDSEAILAGLGLLQDNQLSTEGCIYALSVKNQLEAKGEGQVLNRDEILHRFYKDWEHDWRTNDYDIDADFEFLVLATMVNQGEIEIDFPGGKNIHAANLREIIDMPAESFYSFSHVRRPKNMNTAAVRELFLAIINKDYTSRINDPSIYPELVSKAKQLAAEAVKMGHDVANGIYLENIEIMSPTEGSEIRNRLSALTGLCDKVQTYTSAPKMRNLPWTADQIKQVTAVKAKMTEVKHILKFVEDFHSRMSYLTQARQYMTDNQMKQRVDDALGKLKDIIAEMSDEQRVNDYRTLLDTLIGQYADWYLAEYSRLHINAFQDTEKRKILNSPEKKICEAICGADHDKGYFSVSAQYVEWTRKMSSLTPVNDSVTREAILRSPYQGFNPVQFTGKQLPSLADLKEELTVIYENVDQSLHQILKDESLLANKDILSDSEQQLLQRFNTNSEQLSTLNAERLVEIVGKLHQGINKIFITPDSIRQVLSRPMTPEDAVKAFRQYINSLTVGGNGENIRIILK